MKLIDDELAKRQLEENIIHDIRQFQKYAAIGPIGRNIFIVNLLSSLLIEAKKLQYDESLLNDKNIH